MAKKVEDKVIRKDLTKTTKVGKKVVGRSVIKVLADHKELDAKPKKEKE